jgi:hypothetical protein
VSCRPGRALTPASGEGESGQASPDPLRQPAGGRPGAVFRAGLMSLHGRWPPILRARGAPFRYKENCACTAGRACSFPPAPASVERCRAGVRDRLGDRRDSVRPPVVEEAGAAGRSRHTPWAGASRALRTLGRVRLQGETWRACSEVAAAWSRVRIRSVEGLTLHVEPEQAR